MTRNAHHFAFAALWLALAGCSSGDQEPPLAPYEPSPQPAPSPSEPAPSTPEPSDSEERNGTGSEGNTHHHTDGMGATDNPNATNVEEKQKDEASIGGASVVARLHACGKLSIGTFTNVLRDLGVDVDTDAAMTAGNLLRGGRQALGQPSYLARIPEAAFPTTAAMTKMFDIFVLAAGEIRENLATSATCNGVTVLDDAGKLTTDAVSCIIGVPASDAHVQLANMFVGDPAYEERPTDAVDIGIAALLSTHQLCE